MYGVVCRRWSSVVHGVRQVYSLCRFRAPGLGEPRGARYFTRLDGYGGVANSVRRVSLRTVYGLLGGQERADGVRQVYGVCTAGVQRVYGGVQEVPVEGTRARYPYWPPAYYIIY